MNLVLKTFIVVMAIILQILIQHGNCDGSNNAGDNGCVELALCNLLKGDISRESKRTTHDEVDFYGAAVGNLADNVKVRNGDKDILNVCQETLTSCIDEVKDLALKNLRFLPKYQGACDYRSYPKTLFDCKNIQKWPANVAEKLQTELGSDLCENECTVNEDKPIILVNGKKLRDIKDAAPLDQRPSSETPTPPHDLPPVQAREPSSAEINVSLPELNANLSLTDIKFLFFHNNLILSDNYYYAQDKVTGDVEWAKRHLCAAGEFVTAFEIEKPNISQYLSSRQLRLTFECTPHDRNHGSVTEHHMYVPMQLFGGDVLNSTKKFKSNCRDEGYNGAQMTYYTDKNRPFLANAWSFGMHCISDGRNHTSQVNFAQNNKIEENGKEVAVFTCEKNGTGICGIETEFLERSLETMEAVRLDFICCDIPKSPVASAS